MWFIQEATKIHGNKYDYSSVIYQQYHNKVEIICPTHGPFFQAAGSHIHSKCGCPKCSHKNHEGGYGKKRFNNHPELKTKTGLLYIIGVFDNTEQFIKIGITQKTINERFKTNDRLPYQYNTIGFISGNLFSLFEIEQLAKKQLKHLKYKPTIKFNGYTECFEAGALEELLKITSININ